MKNSMRDNFRLSFGEELTNAITHGVMAVIILFSMPAIAVYSYTQNGWAHAMGIGIFCISLFLMFITSTLYHSMAYDSKHKLVFRILDHCMIYVAIAGSYTPIAITIIGGWQGIVIIVLQWLAVLIGILYKSIAQKSQPKLTALIYLIMGWSVVFFLPILIRESRLVFMLLIALGGVFYSIGAGFYIQKKNYTHAVWHFFIDFAALSHLVAIIFFMVG
jgi:hemolysin III